MNLASEIGEQTLNQIAKVALSSQLDWADELDVRVKTDPGKLVQGQLDSFFVDGSGLVVRSDLRMESMAGIDLKLDRLDVRPGKLDLHAIAELSKLPNPI